MRWSPQCASGPPARCTRLPQGQGTAGSTISFRARLNLRTESAAQAGTAELQFVPEASVGVPQLTMRVSLDVSSGLVVGATYLFEASHVEPQVQVEPEAA